MYGHINSSGAFLGHPPSPDAMELSSPPPQLIFPSAANVLPPPQPQCFIIPYHHDHHQHLQFSSVMEATGSSSASPYSGSSSASPYSGSSGCSSYDSPTSLTSCGATTTAMQQQRPSLIQRSISSHFPQENNGYHRSHFMSSPLIQDLLDMETSSVRRVFSTGDLQHGHSSSRAESPLSTESSAIIESMNKACKYSPEEKKERIERYRSKRNQRNFNKKIKYACRKTLADSRPRIRGRFARNEEIEKNPDQLQWSNNGSGEEDEDDDDNWVNLLDAFSASSIP